MEAPLKQQLWWVGLAAMVLLILLVAPMTRWLAATQLALQVTSVPSHYLRRLGGESRVYYLFPAAPYGWNLERVRDVAGKRPGDYKTRLGYALLTSERNLERAEEDSPLRLESLRALVPRFPWEPSLYANILRLSFREGIALDRREDIVTESMPAVKKRFFTGSQLQTFLEYARTGERLDPKNAYFPMLEAVGLFAARRDREALAAIARASRAELWEITTETI